MAAPILSFEGLGLHQGEGWLFRGLDVHIGGRDRLALIGRNGAGKTTLLKCIADLIETDEGRRTIVPGTKVVLLEQDPEIDGETLADWVLHGPDAPLAPRCDGDRRPARGRSVACRGDRQRRRAPPRGDCPGAGAKARPAAARRADQPPRPRRHRVARKLAQPLHRRLHRHQPRPYLPRPADQKLPVARPRPTAARRDRLWRLRGVDRGGLCRGSARGRQARRQAEARAALAAAGRDRAPPAQPGAARQAQRDAGAARGDARHRGHRQTGDRQGRCPLENRDRRGACVEEL